MQAYIKDHSFINGLLFPAPDPPQYTVNSFPRQLCWLPREVCPLQEPELREPDDDNRIPCLWLPYHRPAKRILIYAHGNGEDLGNTHKFMRALRDGLRCHVLAVEYPGYGVSPGTPNETNVNKEFLNVYNFVRVHMGFEAGDILLFGRSIGSGPCCYIASKYPVGGLILVSAFSSIRDMVMEICSSQVHKSVGYVASKVVADRFSNVEAMKRISVPVLIIHGLSDKLIPYSHSQELFKAADQSSRRAIHFPEEMDHNNFSLKEDILIPIKLHFPSFFTRGSHNQKKTMPKHVFLKPEEFMARQARMTRPREFAPEIVSSRINSSCFCVCLEVAG